MDTDDFKLAISRLERDLEKLEKGSVDTLEPPFLLDADSRVLSVSTDHVKQTREQLRENIGILEQHVSYLTGILKDRERETETLAGMLGKLKKQKEMHDAQVPNGKREAPPTEAEPAAKKPTVTAPTVPAPKK